MSIFTLARRMGTTVPVTSATYGHRRIDADGNDRDLLDAYDAARGHVVGTNPGDEEETDDPGNDETAPERGFWRNGRGGFRTCDLSRVNQQTEAAPDPQNPSDNAEPGDAGVLACAAQILRNLREFQSSWAPASARCPFLQPRSVVVRPRFREVQADTSISSEARHGDRARAWSGGYRDASRPPRGDGPSRRGCPSRRGDCSTPPRWSDRRSRSRCSNVRWDTSPGCSTRSKRSPRGAGDRHSGRAPLSRAPRRPPARSGRDEQGHRQHVQVARVISAARRVRRAWRGARAR